MVKNECFICGLNDSEPFLLAKDTIGVTDQVFSLVKCKKCGLVFLDPVPDREEMKAFYPDGYWPERENRLERLYRDCIMRLELEAFKRFMGEGPKLLEVGSGTGELLYNAEKMGFDCYGVEISKEMVEYAHRNFGLIKLKDADILSASFEDSSFDIVLYNHVFEHIHDPAGTLREVKRILKTDGILVIQVPNIESLQFMLFGEKWLGLSLPQHLLHFSPRTLSLALGKNGFRVFHVLHHSIRNSSAIASFSLTGLSLHKINQNKNGIQTFFYKIMILMLNWILLPLTIVESLLKKGGVITVFARKANE